MSQASEPDRNLRMLSREMEVKENVAPRKGNVYRMCPVRLHGLREVLGGYLPAMQSDVLALQQLPEYHHRG
jgi:hypothetical protein